MGILRVGIAFLAWGLALSALGVSLLAQGGRASPRLDVLTHFAPVYLAAAIVALALAGLAPRGGRIALLVVSVLSVAGAAALMAPEFLSRRTAPEAAAGTSGQIRLIQFNAWGHSKKAEAAVAWLLAQDADIIVVEEAGRVRDRLLDAGYTASCKSCDAIVFARAKPLRIADRRSRGSHQSYISSATYADAAGEFTVVGVHRSWPTRLARDRTSTADLHRFLEPMAKDRLILAGDFNSTPWSFARQREDANLGLIRRTRALFSWPAARVSHNRLPAPFPYLPIDHVYAGPGWATVKVERGPELGSDHYPVIVTLDPTAAAADSVAR